MKVHYKIHFKKEEETVIVDPIVNKIKEDVVFERTADFCFLKKKKKSDLFNKSETTNDNTLSVVSNNMSMKELCKNNFNINLHESYSNHKDLDSLSNNFNHN